jgi:hypothetical protein
MNQKTTIVAIVLATIMAASTVIMALPWESAEASRNARGGDARGGRGGDAESEAEGGDAENEGDSETNDNDNNEGNIRNLGNFVEGGDATSGRADGGDGGTATGGAGGDASGDDAEETP